MADEKKDLDGVGLEIEAPGVSREPIVMPSLPRPLTLDEKKYLLAVERGDVPNVRRMLQLAHHKGHININCLDPLGRGALTLAIDQENLEMVELLVVLGVETRDALLHAINVEFVEAVELLLEHEEIIHKEGEPYVPTMSKRRKYGKCTENILEAYRNGGYGQDECARVYGVPKATIKTYVDSKNHFSNALKSFYRQATFTIQMENVLATLRHLKRNYWPNN